MTSNVTCDFLGASWEQNSIGQNACQVYADLQGACNSSFLINGVTASDPPYMPAANACGCNVVAYNLMAGCGWCQSTILTGWWLTESEWIGNCTTPTVTFSNSLPDSIATANVIIPAWALITPTDTSWLPSQASLAAISATPTLTETSTEATTATGGVSTAQGSFGFTPSSSSTRTLLSGGDEIFNGSGGSDAGKVVGVIVGVILGLYVLAGIIVVVIFFMRQKSREAWYGPMAEHYRRGGQGFVVNQAGNQGYYPSKDQASNSTSSSPSNANAVGYVYQPPPPENPSVYGGYQSSVGHGAYQQTYTAPSNYAPSTTTNTTSNPASTGAYGGPVPAQGASQAYQIPSTITYSNTSAPKQGANFGVHPSGIGYRGHAEV